MTDIILPPKKNVILDATVLSSLMSCGRFLDLRFNHRFISAKGKSNSLEIGSLMHKVFEVFYQHQIKGFPRSVCIGNALIAGQMYITGCPHCASGDVDKPSCGHEAGEYPGLMNTPEDNDGRYKTGWKFALQRCEEYFKHYENDSFVPIAAEWVKGEVIYEDEEIRVLWKAKFDLTLDTNQIGIVSMDHKTFKQRRDKTSLSNQFLGHCVLLNSRNVIVNKVGLQTSLPITECLTREIVSYSAQRIEEWRSEIIPYYAYKLLQYTEAEYFPPNFTHCDTMYGPCPFKSVCESDPRMREEVLRNEFIVGQVWDPTNKEDE